MQKSVLGRLLAAPTHHLSDESWISVREDLGLPALPKLGWREKTQRAGLRQPDSPDCSAPLPRGNEEKERQLVNAVRPILSELTKIRRYENRAAARRNRAIREIVSIK